MIELKVLLQNPSLVIVHLLVTALATTATAQPYGATKCDVPVIRNGYVEKADLAGGSTALLERTVYPETEIVLKCDPGYTIERGATRAVCLPLGVWSGGLAECKPYMQKIRVTCSVPVVPNGTLRVISPRSGLGKKTTSVSELPVGTRIHLRCDRDYFLSEGSHETTCKTDGNWSNMLAKCRPLVMDEEECGNEPDIAHGILLPRTRGTRQIECHNGFKLAGSGIVKCLRSGKWSYAENVCLRICDQLPFIPNGFISHGDSYVGAERHVTCTSGFAIVGLAKIVCNVTGIWTLPGKCEKSCGIPPVILNGEIERGTSSIGTERRIICKEGYTLSGVSSVTCNVNSRWVVGGRCRQACGSEPIVLNGNVRPGEYAVGAIRHVVCDVGFVLKGPSTIRCTEIARWSEPGFCKKESIHMAAETGDVEVVKHLIKSQPELIETRNAYGDSPLWRAAHNGQVEIVRLLLDSGADIETKGLYGRTPLHEAAAFGHTEVVKILLKRGANVYAKSNSHDSEDMPIHLAAFEGHLEVIRALIETHADLVDKKDMHGRTAMDLAKISQHDRASDIVRFFKSRYCEKKPVIENGRVLNGSSAIGQERQIVCDNGYANVGPITVKCRPGGIWSQPGTCVLRQCHEASAVVNGKVSDGSNEIGSERTISCFEGFVLSGPGRIRCESNSQWSRAGSCQPAESIFWAATMGHDHVVKALLERNPEMIDDRDRNNNTILAVAASHGQTEIVKYLLTEPRIKINAKNKEGRTALALAALKGNLPIVKLLVERGANPHAKSSTEDYEDQPIHFAAMSGFSKILEYLIKHDRNLLLARNRDGDHPIHRAVVGGHVSAVKTLLALGANTESQNNDGWTPLCHAAAEGSLAIVRLLVDRGANVYARSNADDDEDMPIHLAAYFGHLNVVNFLIERRPDLLLAKNREGESAINRAAVGGHTTVVEFLLSKGVSIETKGFRGRTPLHEAASKGHIGLVKMLVRNNANVSARSDRDSDRGSLPIHLASYFGQLDVVRYLIEAHPELAQAKNSRGQTALEHAIAGGTLHHAEDVVRYLTDKLGAHAGAGLP